MDLSVNRILSNQELRELYNLSLGGIVSKTDMHATIKKQLLKFAETQKLSDLSTIHNLLKANPDTTFAYWTERLSSYQEPFKIINWLKDDPPESDKVDTRFHLGSFFEQAQATGEYKSIQRQIEYNGHYVVTVKGYNVKIFTPELVSFFFAEKVPSINMDTQAKTEIYVWEYLNSYIKAYEEGEQYFENKFKVSPDTLYGTNAEKYLRDIQLNYFHIKHTGSNKGWVFVKERYPVILTHKIIKEYGYYSGIVNKVEEQAKTYPQLFGMLEKPEIDSPLPIAKRKTESNETELSIKINKHFGFFNKNCPRCHKQILNDADFNKLLRWTNYFFENEFKVPEISEPIKTVNTNKTFVQLAFRYLFKELHKNSPYPPALFEFYKGAFSDYSQDRKSNFGKVQNRDEVKGLMKID